MAYKRTLEHKRKKSPPLPELIDTLIERSMAALRTGQIKATVSDLIRMVHLRQKLYPVTPVSGTATWVDGRHAPSIPGA